VNVFGREPRIQRSARADVESLRGFIFARIHVGKLLRTHKADHRRDAIVPTGVRHDPGGQGRYHFARHDGTPVALSRRRSRR